MNQYKVVQKVGSGFQGVVYKGYDNVLKQEVAIKIANGEEKNLNALMNEVCALKKIQNYKHVVCLYDVIKSSEEDAKHMAMVMEYAMYGDLFEIVLNTGSLDEYLGCYYFKQVLNGLKHVHEVGVIHRDLKLENFLIDEDCNVKICDFGLASTNGTDLLEESCGTLTYMAPEVLAGIKYVGTCADVWSLGVALFVMISGFPPFHQANREDWWYRCVQEKNYSRFWKEHERHAVFSNELKHLLSNMLCANPLERYTLLQIENHPWVQKEFKKMDYLHFKKSIMHRIQKSQNL